MKSICQIFFLLILTSCSVNRFTTTSQTAVEQALINQSISKSVNSAKIPAGNQQSCFVEIPDQTSILCVDKLCNSYSADYLEQVITAFLLANDYYITNDISQADIIVKPQVEYAAVDDADALIGLPSIPIPIPGSTGVETPEIALFSTKSQFGRSKVNLIAVEQKTGELVFVTDNKPFEAYYKRWGILFFISWRTTNLGKPF